MTLPIVIRIGDVEYVTGSYITNQPNEVWEWFLVEQMVHEFFVTKRGSAHNEYGGDDD